MEQLTASIMRDECILCLNLLSEVLTSFTLEIEIITLVFELTSYSFELSLLDLLKALSLSLILFLTWRLSLLMFLWLC